MSNDLAQRLGEIVRGPIKSLGFEVVQVEFKSNNTSKILEILIENPTGDLITIKDCELVSKNISIILDVEEILQSKYYLEVSSAGLERPLVEITDYQKFLGYEARIKLTRKVNEKTKYQGTIHQVEGNEVHLKSNDTITKIDFDLIKNARLVLTDQLFKQILNKKF